MPVCRCLRQPRSGRGLEHENPNAFARSRHRPSAIARAARSTATRRVDIATAAPAGPRPRIRQACAQGFAVRRGAAWRAPKRRRVISAGSVASSNSPPTCSNARTPSRHCGAERKMRRDDKRARLVERSGRKGRERGVAWMMHDGHVRSPSSSRRRFMARRSRDFTVPSGRLSCVGDIAVSAVFEERKLQRPAFVPPAIGRAQRGPARRVPPISSAPSGRSGSSLSIVS